MYVLHLSADAITAFTWYLPGTTLVHVTVWPLVSRLGARSALLLTLRAQYLVASLGDELFCFILKSPVSWVVTVTPVAIHLGLQLIFILSGPFVAAEAGRLLATRTPQAAATVRIVDLVTRLLIRLVIERSPPR
jgi:hypothetical protein